MASLLLIAAAVLTAIDGRWWRALYLVVIGAIVWLVLGRQREPPRAEGGPPPTGRG